MKINFLANFITFSPIKKSIIDLTTCGSLFIIFFFHAVKSSCEINGSSKTNFKFKALVSVLLREVVNQSQVAFSVFCTLCFALNRVPSIDLKKKTLIKAKIRIRELNDMILTFTFGKFLTIVFCD